MASIFKIFKSLDPRKVEMWHIGLQIHDVVITMRIWRKHMKQPGRREPCNTTEKGSSVHHFFRRKQRHKQRRQRMEMTCFL